MMCVTVFITAFSGQILLWSCPVKLLQGIISVYTMPFSNYTLFRQAQNSQQVVKAEKSTAVLAMVVLTAYMWYAANMWYAYQHD